MIREPKCFLRRCIHYKGILQPNKSEKGEVNICMAFPKGIPDEIAYGNNLHKEPLEGQKNDIVYEKRSKK